MTNTVNITHILYEGAKVINPDFSLPQIRRYVNESIQLVKLCDIILNYYLNDEERKEYYAKFERYIILDLDDILQYAYDVHDKRIEKMTDEEE